MPVTAGGGSPAPDEPGQGGKGITNRPPVTPTTYQHSVRRAAARHIAIRAEQFSIGTITKHPHTVAGLVHSSLSTTKLANIAQNLDEAFAHAQSVALHEDPAGGIAPVSTDPVAAQNQAIQERRAALMANGATLQEALDATGGPDITHASSSSGGMAGALTGFSAATPITIPAAATAFQTPYSAAFRWAGESLDDIGGVPGLGAIIRPLHATADVTLGVAEKAAAIGGRAIGSVAAIAPLAVSEIKNREGDVNTDWGALLDFWRLDHHDPFTTGVANVMGYHVDDPKFAETAMSIDIVAGTLEQIALAKVMVGVHAKLTIPGETGDGLLDSRTWADHNILNGGMFNKLATLYENSPPAARVGRTLAASRHLPPRMAKAFADAFEANRANGGTRVGAIANMKQVFVDVIKNDPEKATARLKTVNDALETRPSEPGLLAEKAALESELETIAAHDPIEQWPRYQDVRGMLKGVDPVTRGGKYIKAIYDRRPLQAVTDITKTVDNVRSKPKLYDWNQAGVVKDAMRQNAQNAARWLRGARVPEPVVSQLLGEMTESGMTFETWYRHVTQSVADHAPSWANPVQVRQIVSAMRNEEVFTNRANYTTIAADGGEVRRPVVEKANGVTPPTQMNELAHSANLPDVQIVHDITADLARTKHNPGVAWVKKTFDNVMGGWRAQTIFSRGPAIVMTIQGEEGLTRLFTNSLRPGRFVDWVVHKLPVSEEAQAAVADRLGLTDVHEARMAYAEMKKHPEMLGQTMGEAAAETTHRIEAPIKRFKSDFMDGTIETTSKEAKEVFSDIVWQIEHTAGSADTRALVSFGAERTARILLGETKPGGTPVREGYVRLYSERYLAKGETPQGVRTGGLAASGATEGRPVVWATEGEASGAARHTLEGTSPKGSFTVEFQVPEAEVHGPTPREVTAGNTTPTRQVYRNVPPEDIIRVYEPGQGGVTQVRSSLENWGQHIIEDTATDPTYAGLAPRERVMEFLTRKEDELTRLAGGHPEVVDLMSKGRTKTARLADPEGELELAQDELNQLHLTQMDPETPAGMKLSLVERRMKLLDGATDDTPMKTLRVTKHNRAVRDWLMKETLDGRYELPDYRQTLVSKSAYETAEGLHHGFISRATRVQYGVMKFMNRDAMRGGFTEASYLKWRKRYEGLGWTEKQASEGAVAQAMFEARDWLHDIGNKSSFQRFFRNEAPFYHAWERVAYRWLAKVPNMMGAGFTPLGWGIEANIVNGTIASLKQLGVIKEVQGPGGEKELHTFLPNPVALLNWIPGIEVPKQIDVFDPKTALFPPLHLLSHPPGLAPQTLFVLSEAADLTHAQWLKSFHDEVTMDGALSLQFPGAGQATKIWEAITGDVPPWAIGHSRNYQEYVVGRSRDAALRYAYTEMVTTGDPSPNPEDFATHEEYAAARQDWWGRWSRLADEYHTGLSMTNLLAVESPLTTFKPTTQEEVAWKNFLQENHLMGERTQEDWDLIDEYLGDHPESLAYNVGMYTEDSKWPKDEGYAAFKDAVGRGDIKVLSQADFRSKLALSQEWEYKNKADAIALRKAGLQGWHTWSASKKLLHYGEYTDATRPAWDNFQEFLNEDPRAEKLYNANKSEVSRINDHIQQVKSDMQYMSPTEAAKADRQVQALYDKRAEATDYGKTSTDHMRWYRNVVMNDYYNATGAIYDRIDELEGSGLLNAPDAIAHQYDLLRKANATYPDIVGPDGKTYPKPEAYVYASKTEQEKNQARVKWAAVPPSWLSPFAYETTYGPADGNVKKYFNAEQKLSDYFDSKTADMSHSSNEYASWVKWRERSLDILSKRAGADTVRALEKAPRIARLHEAGLTPDSEGMNWIVDESQNIANRLASQGSSLWSSSQDAQYYRGWLESYIAKMRDPQSGLYDVRVDHFFTHQQHALKIVSEPALYRYVLFGISPTNTIDIPIDYSQENKAANA